MSAAPLAGKQSMDEAFAAVRLLVLDFDGVMTDNRVLVDETGREAVWCHRGDGFGISRMPPIGVEVVVLSKEQNPVVTARCRKLKIHCIQGCDDKLPALQQLARDRGVAVNQVAYVGNDLNDLECLQWAGLPIVVADAEPAVRGFARFTTSREGGKGAVREVCDRLEATRMAVRR